MTMAEGTSNVILYGVLRTVLAISLLRDLVAANLGFNVNAAITTVACWNGAPRNFKFDKRGTENLWNRWPMHDGA